MTQKKDFYSSTIFDRIIFLHFGNLIKKYSIYSVATFLLKHSHKHVIFVTLFLNIFLMREIKLLIALGSKLVQWFPTFFCSRTPKQEKENPRNHSKTMEVILCDFHYQP